MKHGLGRIAGASLFALLCACGLLRHRAGVPDAVDYAAVQKKAAAFVPAIGAFGGELIQASFEDPRCFNPITSTDIATSELTGLMYEGLVRINSITLKPEPGLAASWNVSPDGLTWVFSIRPGVVWSDSVAFTARDVAFTFDSLVLNDSINPNSSRDLFTVNGRRPVVKVLDSMTIQFTLPVPYAPFLRAMAQEILPVHRYAPLAHGGRFSAALGLHTSPDSMVGTGPFILESFVAGRTTVLRRNPLYWQKDSAGKRLPYLSRLVYTIVADQNAELQRFKQGRIDYMKVKGEDFPALAKDESRGNYTVYRLGPASGSYFVFFNQNTGRDPATGKPYIDSVKRSWFCNRNFRKAMAMALDKQDMINSVMNGLGYPQWGPMSPSEGYFYNPDVATYRFDTARARALLAEAGFADRNKDGVVEDAAGHPVEFTLSTNSGNTVRTRLAEIICRDLAAIGIKAHFQRLEFGALTDRIDNPPYNWDAVLLALSGNIDPHFGKNVWQSSGYLHMWHPGLKTPATHWEARIDSLFDSASKELDEAKRKELYDEWQRIAADELPFIYTVLPEQIYCLSNKFRNINPSVTGGLLNTIERIYVDTAFSKNAATAQSIVK
jgi:peptide/nickel transport system substrate-binding protein